LELPVSAHAIPAAAALRGTLDLARAQRLTTYDAVYLHLAMLSGLPLASQDDDLRAAAGRVGVPLVA
jgi:predicted nucleic acid-binding protein